MAETSTSNRFTYRAFISYSHRDKAWADWLHKALETYRVPSRLVGTITAHGVVPRRLNPVFRDRDELASAAELGRKVNEALAQSENLIVICSPAAAASRWVNEEVLAYKRMGRAERIFCLIVEGEPNATDMPGREAEECFCPALRFKLDASGQPTAEKTEPIAADARPGKDGKQNAKLKLIAGMLDVGFDALKQREQRRQLQRMTAIAALAMLVMAVTVVLALAALVSRHHAVVAQHEAVVAKQSAVRRQGQAEDLVNFMLGDLTTKLRQVDRLDILGAVDDKAMAYFESLPPTDVNATELAQRAKALQRIGDVRMDQTRLSASMEAFQQAVRINRQLAQRAPDDAERQNAYGENLLWIGYNYWNQGKLDHAERAFAESAAVLQKAATLAPDDDGVKKNLDFVYNNLGNVADARGELESARAYFAKDFALDQRMAKKRPGDPLWQTGFSYAYGNLGNIALAQGQLEVALANFVKQREVMTKVVANSPSDRQMQSQLMDDNGILARTLAMTGQAQAAADAAQAAVGIGASLVKFDSSHTDWADSYANDTRLLGQLLLVQGKTAAAGKLINKALAIATRLVAKDAANAVWRSHLAQAQLAAARLALVGSHLGAARELALAADTNIQRTLTGGSSKAESIRIEAEGELLLGQLAAAAGDGSSAMSFRQRALSHMRPLAEHSRDPRNLDIWTGALLATNNRTSAMPVIETLRQMGYRPASFVRQMHEQAIAYAEDPALARRLAQAMASGSDVPPAR